MSQYYPPQPKPDDRPYPPQEQPQHKRKWSYAEWYSRQPLHVRIPILTVLAVFVIIVACIGILFVAALVHTLATMK